MTPMSVKSGEALGDHDYCVSFSKEVSTEMLKHQEINVLAYIGGFIVRKTRDLLCVDCQDATVAIADTSAHEFINLKNYDSKQRLYKPSEEFIGMLKVAEDYFNANIDDCVRQGCVKQTLYEGLCNACEGLFRECNECNSKQRALKLFTTIRLHHSLNLFNDVLDDSAIKRNCKKYAKLSS